MQSLYARLAPHLVALIELLLMAATAVLILVHSRKEPEERMHAFPLGRGFVRLAARKRLCVLLVGISVVAVRVALTPILGVPEPRYNDEFSYLLAADTFAQGRLTNPTHPMWIHFESFHINQKPTYMSMYAPAQGLVLAAGQLLGHPWIGQLLVTALMCSAMCWMLQAWVPSAWALFGALLAVLRLGILSYWMNGYWSASVVALGGALVLGAWPRIHKSPRVTEALLMGIGLVILANSRPYEGLVFSIPVALFLLLWLAGRHKPPLGKAWRRVVLPLLLVLACGTVATGYYYWRVTGSPFRAGYSVNSAAYSGAPYFLWQKPQPAVDYHHAVMRQFYDWTLDEFRRNFTIRGYVARALEKALSWWQFYLGPLLTVPLLAFPRVLTKAKMRLPIAICAAMIAGFAIETWTLPHYFAPAASALYILLIEGMRELRLWRPGGRAIGAQIVRAIPMLACAMILLRVSAAAVHVQIEPAWPRGNLERARILHQLRGMTGGQLVLVAYGPHHDIDHEWVYNRADIDGAKVVWARDMGPKQNQELVQYFSNRQVWRVAGDSAAPELEPYVDSVR
jgi:hypothetical protein